MLPLTLAAIADITGGRLTDVPDPTAQATAPLSFDSRQVQPGGLFACLSGTRSDGHSHAPAALAQGAVAALATRPVGVPAVIVGDVLTAMADLARHTATQLTATTVIAITGSAGKTTAKDLLLQILRRTGPTVATERSFNNEIGLPATVLRATADTRHLILEMGARGKGHIAHLCAIAPPRISTVLGIGSAHLGEFGSRQATADAKAEILDNLPTAEAGGIAVLNADDELVRAMTTRTSARVLWFGRHHTADIHAQDSTLDHQGRARFILRTPDGTAPVRLRLHGEHNITNALAAAALAHAAGTPLDSIATALNVAEPLSSGRMQILTRPDGVTVINDAYNANPDSMTAALNTLFALAEPGHAVAVLGEMREIGDESARDHREVGRTAARIGLRQIITVGGPDASAMAEAAQAGGITATHVTNKDHVPALISKILAPGDHVLVKGANALGLETTAQQILRHPSGV
ncbi:UDP-N-acetylmuramoyl-tripeptide--D-alanyl-D-alanine ligase [Streptomyces sp. ISL-99]|uniref:UDP-N-acetylmuramoyl-tripeptide--D-alanyl-D- alanine ligase n=1 Tax=Streptomyces sp. ISL-99 TaxID=2819193 RepID=UPI001BE626DE|nr:UDP-N-acetylmuramoyl-tripeptide--D-alanyl-D-alanine ligase [Streptomyces sp. ISL-99]MBT2525428.1 UDP-N-acetylmuramoyl-tripeptide--D-alanyl-D-alanine ligase [Streptomyces sp. ISL-99]